MQWCRKTQKVQRRGRLILFSTNLKGESRPGVCGGMDGPQTMNQIFIEYVDLYSLIYVFIITLISRACQSIFD
jgi:hypothetical protein